MPPAIKTREREAILQSLRAGVVPRVGLHHIQVGRLQEVRAVMADLERVQQGAAAVRFIIGRFGAGKSFFLNLVRTVALEMKFVVAQADITPDRRLHAGNGQARGLYAQLMAGLCAGSRRDGGALASVVECFVSDIHFTLTQSGADESLLPQKIAQALRPLQQLVSGYDFSTAISRYAEGFLKGNDELMQSSLRWLRAEYSTKTEARADLGVRSIIDDDNIYEYLKLFSAFVRLAGYSGLVVNLDEMGVLSHRLNNSQARNANYEMILRMLNDCLQGAVSGLMFLFAGTDAFLDDRRRGLASYEALSSRLADNSFAGDGLTDLSGPVIRLPNLTPEDMYLLLRNIRHVYASGDESRYLVPDEALAAYLNHCAAQLGAEFYHTPRDAVKGFIGLLSVLEQNQGSDWQSLLGSVSLEPMPIDEPQALTDDMDNSLTSFRL
ncbi:MAG: ATP-binding protein [Armatimonadota bacterium]